MQSVINGDSIIDFSKFVQLGKRKSVSQANSRDFFRVNLNHSRAPAAQKFEDEVKRRQSGRSGKTLVNQLSVADLKKLIKKGIFRGTPFQHYVDEICLGSTTEEPNVRVSENGIISYGGKGPIQVNESNAFFIRRALVQVHPEQFTAETYATL